MDCVLRREGGIVEGLGGRGEVEEQSSERDLDDNGQKEINDAN